MSSTEPRSFWSLWPRSGYLRAIGYVLGVYLLGLLILVVFERTFTFPAASAADWVPAPSPDIQDIWLTSADGTRLHAWWCPQPGSRDALLYCHGNGGNVSHHGRSLLQIRDWLQVNVLHVDYPGYGRSEGTPDEAGCYAAADAAYTWLVEQEKFAPERILLYGSSTGGAVVTDLASRKDHRALILFMTFTTMPDVAAGLYPIYPVHAVMRARFDNRSKLPLCKRPVFLAHGDADRLVPHAHSRELYGRVTGPRQFLTLTGHGHWEVADPEMFRQIQTFLQEHAP